MWNYIVYMRLRSLVGDTRAYNIPFYFLVLPAKTARTLPNMKYCY